jgi:hypothetical protein
MYDIPAESAPTPVPHDMSCAHCGHGLHVYLECGDGCDCTPHLMPGTAARPTGRRAHPARTGGTA